MNTCSKPLQNKKSNNGINFFSPQVIRFEDEERKPKSNPKMSPQQNVPITMGSIIKEEKDEDTFARPLQNTGSMNNTSNNRHGSFKHLQRVPCSIQKVPSLSDLSDPDSSNSLGK